MNPKFASYVLSIFVIFFSISSSFSAVPYIVNFQLASFGEDEMERCGDFSVLNDKVLAEQKLESGLQNRLNYAEKNHFAAQEIALIEDALNKTNNQLEFDQKFLAFYSDVSLSTSEFIITRGEVNDKLSALAFSAGGMFYGFQGVGTSTEHYPNDIELYGYTSSYNVEFSGGNSSVVGNLRRFENGILSTRETIVSNSKVELVLLDGRTLLSLRLVGDVHSLCPTSKSGSQINVVELHGTVGPLETAVLKASVTLRFIISKLDDEPRNDNSSFSELPSHNFRELSELLFSAAVPASSEIESFYLSCPEELGIVDSGAYREAMASFRQTMRSSASFTAGNALKGSEVIQSTILTTRGDYRGDRKQLTPSAKLTVPTTSGEQSITLFKSRNGNERGKSKVLSIVLEGNPEFKSCWADIECSSNCEHGYAPVP